MSTRLGDWSLQSLTILEKRRGHSRRICLLIPPPGFSGRARLGVINGDRREEFVGQWEEGRNPAIGAAASAHLDEIFAPLVNADSGNAPAWPALFAVEYPPQTKTGPATADLFLEVDATEGAATVLTGELTVPRIGASAVIYLAPTLPHDAPRTCLEPALRAARRDPAVRLALAEAWSSAIATQGRTAELSRLIGTGQVELLRGETDAGRELDLPFPPRTGLWDQIPVHPNATRGLRAALLRGAAGAEAHLAASPIPIHRLGVLSEIHPLAQDMEPYAALAFHALLRKLPPTMPARAFLPIFVMQPEAWPRLGRAVGRWNRSHACPKLILSTPADYFAWAAEIRSWGQLPGTPRE